VKLSIAFDEWPLREPFVIAGFTTTEVVTVTVALEEASARGRGEALGVDYLGETPASVREQLETCRAAIESRSAQSLDQVLVDSLLPPGGARNALDCALWDLRAKLAGRSVWSTLGIEAHPVVTVFTLSLDEPAAMAEAARRAAMYPLLKLKLDADDPAARLAAVRAARPDAELLVDANGSWSFDLLASLGPALVAHRVALVEQPLRADADDALVGWHSPVPLCADESCQTLADLGAAVARYQAVNVKLDKCGGLTDALRLADECERLGLALMVGNMLGSSLAMAPAFVVAQRCRWVDLDGPLLQRSDRAAPMRYEGAVLHPPSSELWG
jgi:L-Ala-D/L-Glu epimerase / N-acetyl-D-glutamate racemase